MSPGSCWLLSSCLAHGEAAGGGNTLNPSKTLTEDALRRDGYSDISAVIDIVTRGESAPTPPPASPRRAHRELTYQQARGRCQLTGSSQRSLGWMQTRLKRFRATYWFKRRMVGRNEPRSEDTAANSAAA
eukprot:767858-Hanusia_phi.AAC.5